ncbi:stress response protein NST1-like isoform X3 [Gossypium arboreum]|uniref:stress response protein NST1-like isoform X3 n=1 Tax=Gossypium arboreum TaxID=29729 RepID=UPI000819783B|nr:stress response protein NST1-like isoform X3 [Gossypium arboreum]
MLGRSILELPRCRGAPWRIPRQIMPQCSSPFIYSRKQFSTSSGENGTPKPESKSGLSKFVLGTSLIGGAILVAYQTGYLEQYGARPKVSIDSTKTGFDEKDEKDIQDVSSRDEEINKLTPHVDLPEQKAATNIDLPPEPEISSETQGENQSNIEGKLNEIIEESTTSVPEKALPEYSQSNLPSADHSADTDASAEGNLKKVESQNVTALEKEIQDIPLDTRSSASLGEKETKTVPSPTTAVKLQDKPSKDIEAPSSLLDAYHLREKAAEGYLASLNRKYEQLSKEKEAFGTAIEELNEGYLSKDGKLVLDFLQAIHAAEKQQAELDARAFAEEKRELKEKYEKELRDSRARELMRTEEAAMLDKELKRERTKAAAAIKSLQERMEEKLRMELEEKEREAEMNLKNAQEQGKAELVSAIANEKAAQIEKMAEANFHINALCMAFYAQSEEAHKIHSIHKLALGALALEDALSKGLPIQKEIDTLYTYLEGFEKDSVLGLVLSSLPEETRYCGTDTLLELNQKFNALKGNLRHFSLIPPGGGGILTHSLAHIASWLKVKEVDESSEGIESIISRVEIYLAEGKLVEAASTLEQGVKGSQAEEIIGDWVKRVRNRAITEQALTVLQSYATCISLT